MEKNSKQMINQNFENITQGGTSQVIEANAGGLNFSQTQGYCIIFCVTIVLVTLIIMITRLIQTAILKINYIRPRVLQKLKEEILGELK